MTGALVVCVVVVDAVVLVDAVAVVRSNNAARRAVSMSSDLRVVSLDASQKGAPARDQD
ncbi:MAG TPA: hypothetical protein VMD91_04795 [Candidatus Sulfotelmatobacter sp.]|nr:hypothetical protein [Candidatus Sulfotelmatobacter sp.]